MTNFEVPEPIINTPYEEPKVHWKITEGEPPQHISWRRIARYHYKLGLHSRHSLAPKISETLIESKTVNRILERAKAWRVQGWPGVNRTTLELLNAMVQIGG